MTKMKSCPNNHTHYQAAPANATTQAWQRVRLFNRTTKTTDKQTDEKEHRTDNTGLAKVAVQYSADTFVVKIATFAKPENDRCVINQGIDTTAKLHLSVGGMKLYRGGLCNCLI